MIISTFPPGCVNWVHATNTFRWMYHYGYPGTSATTLPQICDCRCVTVTLVYARTWESLRQNPSVSTTSTRQCTTVPRYGRTHKSLCSFLPFWPFLAPSSRACWSESSPKSPGYPIHCTFRTGLEKPSSLVHSVHGSVPRVQNKVPGYLGTECTRLLQSWGPSNYGIRHITGTGTRAHVFGLFQLRTSHKTAGGTLHGRMIICIVLLLVGDS
jgi:hypothetical protein